MQAVVAYRKEGGAINGAQGSDARAASNQMAESFERLPKRGLWIRQRDRRDGGVVDLLQQPRLRYDRLQQLRGRVSWRGQHQLLTLHGDRPHLVAAPELQLEPVVDLPHRFQRMASRDVVAQLPRDRVRNRLSGSSSNTMCES